MWKIIQTSQEWVQPCVQDRLCHWIGSLALRSVSLTCAWLSCASREGCQAQSTCVPCDLETRVGGMEWRVSEHGMEQGEERQLECEQLLLSKVGC